MNEWAEEGGQLIVWGLCEHQTFRGVSSIRFVKSNAAVRDCRFLDVFWPEDRPPPTLEALKDLCLWGGLWVEQAPGVRDTIVSRCYIQCSA